MGLAMSCKYSAWPQIVCGLVFGKCIDLSHAGCSDFPFFNAGHMSAEKYLQFVSFCEPCLRRRVKKLQNFDNAEYPACKCLHPSMHFCIEVDWGNDIGREIRACDASHLQQTLGSAVRNCFYDMPSYRKM